MAITDFNTYKPIEVTSASGTPTISRALCFKITSGDDTTTGTGEIVLDWTNISSQADIGVYDENDNLLDYYFESFDATNETAVIWVYRDWVRDGSIQAKIAYGNGPSDQSVNSSIVFDKESNLKAGYLFNEDSGDATDVTSNNYDATVSGAAQGQTGIVDGAYSYDGSDDKVNTGEKDNLGVSNSVFCILLWVYFNNTNESWFCGNYDGSDAGGALTFSRVASSRIGLYDGIDDQDPGSGTDVSTGEWVLVGFVRTSSTNYDFYINGAYAASISTSQSVFSDSTTNMAFGDGWDGSFILDGLIDHSLFYDTDITETIISSIYDATKSSPDLFSQQVLVVINTDSPTNATSFSATLNGTLNDLRGNPSLDVYFEWGTDTNYGNTTATQTISSVPTSFDADISGLAAFTTYHYRSVATDGSNYWYGGDVVFYAADLRDADETQAEFSSGTLNDVEADTGDFLRLADTDVLSFDGNDNYVNCGSNILSNDDAWSISCWIFANYIDGRQTICGYRDESNWSIIFRLDNDDGDKCFRVYTKDGGGNTVVTKIPNTSEDNWVHLTATFDKDTLRLYKGGSLESSQKGSTSGYSHYDIDFTIGRRLNDADPFDGLISDLCIWNTVRTQTEIQDNMNKRLNGDETGLVAYYKLDEGSGDTATDSAGSNDGTINGASWEGPKYIFDPMNLDGTGNRVVQLDLSSLNAYSDSLIEWTATLNGQSLTIETRYSLDGGSSWSSWQTATNGDPVPGLSSGEDLSNALLECRETLSTSDASTTPQLERRAIYLAEETNTIITVPLLSSDSQMILSELKNPLDFELNAPILSSESRMKISVLDYGYPHSVCGVLPKNINRVISISLGNVNKILNS